MVDRHRPRTERRFVAEVVADRDANTSADLRIASRQALGEDRHVQLDLARQLEYVFAG